MSLNRKKFVVLVNTNEHMNIDSRSTTNYFILWSQSLHTKGRRRSLVPSPFVFWSTNPPPRSSYIRPRKNANTFLRYTHGPHRRCRSTVPRPWSRIGDWKTGWKFCHFFFSGREMPPSVPRADVSSSLRSAGAAQRRSSRPRTAIGRSHRHSNPTPSVRSTRGSLPIPRRSFPIRPRVSAASLAPVGCDWSSWNTSPGPTRRPAVTIYRRCTPSWRIRHPRRRALRIAVPSRRDCRATNQDARRPSSYRH